MKKPINDSIHVQMGGKMLHIKKSQFYAGGICFVFFINLGNLMKKFILSLITNMVGHAKCPLREILCGYNDLQFEEFL